MPLSALAIGLFESDMRTDVLRLDPVAARMVGLPEPEVERGVSWQRFLTRFHPDDIAEAQTRYERLREGNLLSLWENRVVPEPGVVRWVLVRARFVRDAAGDVRGRGVIIDTTGLRGKVGVDGRSPPAEWSGAAGDLLERIAARVVEVWSLARDLGREDRTRLQPLIELLLYELGCRLTAALRADGAGPDALQ